MTTGVGGSGTGPQAGKRTTPQGGEVPQVVTIAVDAMGSDHGPAPLVEAAVRMSAADLRVVLVGDSARLEPLLASHPPTEGRYGPAVSHAAETITMDEEPALAVRAKPDASVRTMIRLVADGQAQAGVSAGSTGATLAASLLDLGRLPGIRRPAIAGAVPVTGPAGRDVILLDAGGSPDIIPPTLVDWARLGTAYARARGARLPVVGLLNVGSEHGKGNALAREGGLLLQTWAHDQPGRAVFAGNIEPADVLGGAVDVVVTDGFTGNIMVKTLEAAFSHRTDVPPGALVVGVRGSIVVAHGAAGPDEVARAIATAHEVVAGAWLNELTRTLA